MKKYETFLYSAGGLAAIFLILLLANFVLGALPARIDLTQGRLYTLSDGTREVLKKLEAPVKLRLYFSQSDANVPLSIKAYGRHVEDLLAEYRRAAAGKVAVEKLDPQPDSDAEDAATLEGVDAQVTPAGDKFYLGLSVSYLDQKVALSALSPERERLLEYDLTRAVARAASPGKPVVGVMSALPVFGAPPSAMTGGQPMEQQVFVNELRRDYTVKRVSPGAESIDDDVKVLVVIHPRGISDAAQYAIDQFVLRGGKLIAFVDPSAYFDPMAQMAGGPTSSTLDKLFKTWGVGFDPGKVVMDMRYVTGAGPRALPTLLSLNDNAFDQDDVATARLGSALLPFSGVFTGKAADGLKETVLMKTSAFSQLVDATAAIAQGEAAIRGFQPSNTEYPLAIRLAGKFRTAFPDGKPKADDKGDKKPPAKAPDAKPEAPGLKESKGETAVALVADSDFVNDGAAVQVQELFGQRIVIQRNGNLAFAQALVDQFAGDPALVELRSRASASRPFTVIRDMEARAQQAYLGKIKALEDSLNQTQEKLAALQRARAPGAGTILSPEQQAELENFRKKAAETRRELKDVRKDLRADSEALQTWTKVVNIALMPLLVAVAGVLLALWRRRRKVRL
jgi:gliding motility-associatede transport system auxiliary component